MKTHSLVLIAFATGCAVMIGFPRSAAAITDEEFRALQQQMQQQAQQIQDLQKAHDQDQQEIQQLKQQVSTNEVTTSETQKKLEDTQKKVEETQQTAAAAQEAASKLQPIHPVPSEGILATHNFTLAGDAEVQYGKADGQHGSFGLADFAPIFLYRANDNILFEAGFDVQLQSNHPGGSGETTTLNMSFATLDYLFNDDVTVVAGKMLLPLGTYSERGAGWLNKIPDDPLPRSLLPGAGVGLQLRGARSIGDSGQMVTYAIYGVNGPQSVDGTGNSTNLDLDITSVNQHGAPSAGGRIGWFYPWEAHKDLELGVSGQSGTWDDNGKEQWSAAVVDGAFHFTANFELKGEYIYTWQETADVGTITPKGWWVQAGYKLAGLDLDVPMIPSTELVARFDTMRDGLQLRTDRTTAGLVYYITNTLQFEGDYEWITSSDQTQANNQFILQLSYGF